MTILSEPAMVKRKSRRETAYDHLQDADTSIAAQDALIKRMKHRESPPASHIPLRAEFDTYVSRIEDNNDS